ncbi:MAG: glycosyltransferase family 2 protein [Synergistaceae bacterium]|nr:glycosyltransferase family 2 protein [Synergistaceae bacterium]
MTQPLVSIIVPTYNGSKRIAGTLTSIINQDYENLEIILVDDVSTDNTVEVAQRVLEESGRKFLVIRRTVNGRQSAARNTGINAATGKYIMIFDHDDLAEKNFVSSLCNEAEAKEADVVFCGIKFFYEAENRLEELPVTLEPKSTSPDYYLRAWARSKLTCIYTAWNFIFRKEFLDENKLRFTETCYWGEDIEFSWKAIAHAKRVSVVHDALYRYIYFSEQTSAKILSDLKNKIWWHKFAMMAFYRGGRCIMRHTKDRTVRNYALASAVTREVVRHFTLLARSKDRKEFDRLLKTLKHKKIREVMLSSWKIIFYEPELFFKVITLLCVPGIYYRLRSRGD